MKNIELTIEEAKALLDYLIKKPYLEVQQIVPLLGHKLQEAQKEDGNTGE